MARFLKRGKSESEIRDADSRVRDVVEKIIRDIEENVDVAVRRFSTLYDGWCPDSFCLTDVQINEIVGRTPRQVIDDIMFAQKQIKLFAERQLESITDIEVETLPGVFLGHKNIPVNSAGCYIPGGRYPMVASAHMSILTARVAGVKRVIACDLLGQAEHGSTSPAALITTSETVAQETFIEIERQLKLLSTADTAALRVRRYGDNPNPKLNGYGPEKLC